MRSVRKQLTRSRRALTLIEITVTIGIASVVMGISFSSLNKVRQTARVTRCLSNQRQISHALQMFYNDYRALPADGVSDGLRSALVGYLKDKRCFVCPADKRANVLDSYSDYYVNRRKAGSDNLFTLGCPRHADASYSATLFRDGSVQRLALGKVLANGSEVSQAASQSQRTITTGTLSFEDGSTVKVNTAGTGYGVAVVESFRLGDGTLYTVVRVKNEGAVECAVTHGSRFEVVTPSAIIGVKGTRFTVRTLDGGRRTVVNVAEGTVWLQEREWGGVATVHAGESKTVRVEYTQCAHAVRECRPPYRHPSVCPMNRDFALVVGDINSDGVLTMADYDLFKDQNEAAEKALEAANDQAEKDMEAANDQAEKDLKAANNKAEKELKDANKATEKALDDQIKAAEKAGDKVLEAQLKAQLKTLKQDNKTAESNLKAANKTAEDTLKKNNDLAEKRLADSNDVAEKALKARNELAEKELKEKIKALA